MVFGLSRKKQIDEYEAEGEVERIYHEIRQTFRVSGINLIFRTWARYDKFFLVLWNSIRPNAGTRLFEDAADSVRAQAVLRAGRLDRLRVPANVSLGESQAYQLKAALDLYHYINPKLLVMASAVRLSLTGGRVRETIEGAKFLEMIERGVPEKMYPMEMISEDPKEERINELFADIRQVLNLPSINSDYRTLALWPDYLIEAWKRLRPMIGRQDYVEAAEEVRQVARDSAGRLPYPVISREQLEELGEDAGEITQITEKFEDILAPLIINIALFQLDWHDRRQLVLSPFPAAAR
ncbi:MAG: hypothetical protein C4520_21070 [Candidatus Abyssobacteria bacterium SURF_5]|uniref:Uncharacterized protein n=1 Tax=Abyssobacteria bacterium (strain SURF_5) TaxID=2093360 RepID=A0A3A4MXJ2_ABYX5|nr:MAG: hypothetical protein C4520_21070 [Candidatus Abyssubacteria bacterium SURF_5]